MRIKNFGTQYAHDNVISVVINSMPVGNAMHIYSFAFDPMNIPDKTGWWSILSYRMSNNIILLATNTWNGKFASARVLDNASESEIVWRISNYIS